MKFQVFLELTETIRTGLIIPDSNEAIYNLSFRTYGVNAIGNAINSFIIPPRRPLDRQLEAMGIDLAAG